MSLRRRSIAAGVLAISFATTAFAANYDESINGDLSGDRLAPTNLVLSLGNNLVTASSIGNPTPDREYLHWSLAPGLSLSQVVVQSYSGGGDDVAFIGVQPGTTLTEPAVGANAANMLGYTHMGEVHEGTNILDDMSTGPGSQGFTPPLTGSDYTFWMQQTGPGITSSYTLNFVVVPEPTGAASLGALACGWVARRRRPAR